MRKTPSLLVFLLLAAFAVAQQTTPSAPADQHQPQSQSQSATAPGQDNGPSNSSGLAIVEGCLGGANPNYTITAKSGTTYELKVPKGADVSPLAKHIGEPVAVLGVVDDSTSASSTGATSGSIAGSENAKGSASATKAIHALKIGRGTGTCPAGSGGTTAKPGPKTK